MQDCSDGKKIFNPAVIANSMVAPDIFLMRLLEPAIASCARAGQFINIAIPQCSQILWRRPFSIHKTDVPSGMFDILYQIRGKGTAALRDVAPGTTLNILGPLGNSFRFSPSLREMIIVAGGVGIAPFALLLQDKKDRKITTTLFYGVKSADHLCGEPDYKKHSDSLVISTEDGSQGYKGFVTELLANYLADMKDSTGRELFVCGPTPMLQAVRELAIRYRIPAQVSVENLMACGFGACMGCAVKNAVPGPDEPAYWLACKDGPVFNLDKITFDE